MTTAGTFTGFPQQGIQFLAELANNNNREWFEANRTIFESQLQAPAQVFVAALGERLQSLSPNIVYDTRVNGSGSLMRIYRDVRFSKDKTPYNTNISMAFWQGSSKKTAVSGFFLRVEPDGVKMLTGLHTFDKPILNTYRAAVTDDDLGTELETVMAQIQQTGDYTIEGQHFARVPRGYDAEHPRAELLRYNGLYAFAPQVSPAELYSANLVDVCYNHCQNMAPLHDWLVKIGSQTT